jgi:hypothetical protein
MGMGMLENLAPMVSSLIGGRGRKKQAGAAATGAASQPDDPRSAAAMPSQGGPPESMMDEPTGDDGYRVSVQVATGMPGLMAGMMG